MLYLAEVTRKSRVIGGGKAEFKLLAYQKSELSWHSVVGEEIISAPDDVAYSTGMLVLVDLSAAKQVQRHSEAGRQLVSILQNFSRLYEKAKTQEEEIEQWKQSLTYQSQELNRREMEMEARQEQLQQMEEEFERLEQQRQEIDVAQAELTRLQQEYERKSQDLEGAWAQIRGAEAKLEERQIELQQAAILDEGQSQHLQDLLSQMRGSVAPVETIYEQLHLASESIAQQQSTLDQHWQNLGQHQASAQQLQTEVDQQKQVLSDRWHAWHQMSDDLGKVRAELQAKQDCLQLKQEQVQITSVQIQHYEALRHQLLELMGASDRVDLESLEHMPLEELQTTVRELEKDLEKLSRFVNSQEEELSLQKEAIDELHNQIQQASEYDRLRFENELVDEQDRYQMLNETLVGQRRNLHERQSVLRHHQNILARRQGYPVCEGEQTVDLTPVLAEIDQRHQQLNQELQQIEQTIQQLHDSIRHLQEQIEQTTVHMDRQRQELVQLDEHTRSQVAMAAALQAKVTTYQETLQPIQDNLNALKQQLEGVIQVMAESQAASTRQQQALHEMQETVQQLINPSIPAELAVS